MNRKNIAISAEIKGKLEALKGTASFNTVVEVLLSAFLTPKVARKGSQKVEFQLIKWLYFGGLDKKITVNELRLWTRARLEACKQVYELYIDEITEFNKQF